MKKCARCSRLVGKRTVVCQVCRKEHSEDIIRVKLQKPEVRKQPIFIPLRDVNYYYVEKGL